MVALQNATQGAIPLFGFKVSHRVRGCLGALGYTELGKDSTRMVLCCLGLVKRRAAISAFVKPSPRSRSTSISR